MRAFPIGTSRRRQTQPFYRPMPAMKQGLCRAVTDYEKESRELMTRIFVGNLPHTATESDIRTLFARYGRVSSVQIKTDIATNRPRGFAFVTMPSLEDADEAIAHLSQFPLNGRPLTVNEAQARNDDRQRDASACAARRDALALFGALQSD